MGSTPSVSETCKLDLLSLLFPSLLSRCWLLVAARATRHTRNSAARVSALLIRNVARPAFRWGPCSPVWTNSASAAVAEGVGMFPHQRVAAPTARGRPLAMRASTFTQHPAATTGPAFAAQRGRSGRTEAVNANITVPQIAWPCGTPGVHLCAENCDRPSCSDSSYAGVVWVCLPPTAVGARIALVIRTAYTVRRENNGKKTNQYLNDVHA